MKLCIGDYKLCNRCQTSFPLGKSHIKQRLYTCNQCLNQKNKICRSKKRQQYLEAQRRYRARHAEKHVMDNIKWAQANRVKIRGYAKTWRENNNMKTYAHSKLNRAVANGDIQKPDTCQACGMTSRVHGHHENYYLWQYVDWLCSKCHNLRHKELEGIGWAA